MVSWEHIASQLIYIVISTIKVFLMDDDIAFVVVIL